MKQRLTIFAMLMAATIAPPNVLSQDFSRIAPSGQTLYFRLDNGGAVVVHPAGNNGSYVSGNLIIPDSVSYGGHKYAVTALSNSTGNGTFYNCTGLTSVVIPNTVKEIKNNSFRNCSGLTSVTMSDSVAIIGSSAFFNCNSLDSIVIPNSIESIGDYAFKGCSGLSSITIGGVISIGDHAFYGCSGLSRTNYTGTIAQWCNISFYYSTTYNGFQYANPTFYSHNLYINDTLLTELVVPDGVTVIKKYAFIGCNCITSVYIPNTVTTIKEDAFSGCSNMESITVGNSVTNIERYAFAGCTGLTRVNYLGSISQWCNIEFPSSISDYQEHPEANPLFYAHNLYIADSLVRDLTIPGDVTIVKPYSFVGCSALNSLTFGSPVTSIGMYAFSHCNNLSTVNIDGSISYISVGAFNDCGSLTDVTIPPTTTYIHQYAFCNCTSISSITIPASITYIGNYAFYNCTSLETVNMMPTTAPSIDYYSFVYNSPDRVFNIPCGSGFSYVNTWYTYGYNYASSLREPIVDISFNVESIDSTKGTAQVIQQNGYDIACRDSSIIIRADSNYGYHFDHWSNGRTSNPDTLFLSGDSSVTAFFSPNQYTLTVLSANEELGSVSEGGTFNYLDTVLIEATVTADHYHFVRWSDNNTDNPRQYVITGDATLRAYFSIDKFTVTAVPNNSERGSVNGGREYSYGTVCTLTAGAFSGYQFAKWSDGTTSNPYIFAVSEDVDLRALFVTEGEQIYSINASSADPAMGKVYGGGYAVNGDEVTLRAVSHPGYYFSHWNDNETDSTRTIEVHGNLTLTAHFASNVGIADIITNNIRIFSHDRQIIVEGSEGMRIWVFDMMGRVIYNGKTSIIPIQQTGVYIVKVGNNPPRKVVVMR